MGKPSQNAAEHCVHDDHKTDNLRKGRGISDRFLTGRTGELVEILADRKIDVAFIQETRWRSSGCRFSALGKRHKLFWMGNKVRFDVYEYL